MTSLNTRGLLKDKSNRLGTGDGGCNEAEYEIDSTSTSEMESDDVIKMGPIKVSKSTSEMESYAATNMGTINTSATIPANKLGRLESYSHTDNDADGSGEDGKEEVEMDTGKSREMEIECLSSLQRYCQLLSYLAEEMKMAEGNVSRVDTNWVRIQQVTDFYNSINEAMPDFHLLFLPGNTEAGSRMLNSVRDEVELKQMTGAGMQDTAKSFLNEQVIGPLPQETETEGESGKQQQSELLSPVTLQPDSAMDLKQAQGSNESKPWPTVEDMHRLGLEWEPPRLNEPDPLPDFVMPELPWLELSYPKDDVSSADDDDMKKEMDRGKSAQQIAQEEKEMAAEAKNFTSYRSFWESSWGADGHGSFEDMTTVSSTHFTHLTPGCSSDSAAISGATLQIFTIKLKEIKGGLEWPLSVYGVVAARDCVDRNRNLLFSCDRRRSQKLNKDDPFLPLIGPSRAIVFTDPADFEIQLRVKGRTLSQDRALISGRYHYTGGCNPGLSTICFKNCFCTTELCMERIERTVQATVLGVRVKNGPWPFDYGGQVACLSPSRTAEVIGGKVTYINDAPSMEVVLLASRGRKMPRGSYGYLRLSRHVVSVELEGSLKFVIQAYSESGDIATQGEVCFMPKDCNTSQETFSFGDPKVEVEIIVAWSLLVSAKQRIAARGWEFEGSDDLELALTGLGV